MATASTKKAPTYTPEQTAELVSAYKGATDTASRKAVVDEFAAKFAKGTRSIVAKLVRMDVYVKPEYVTKAGEKPVQKDDTADIIGNALSMTEAEITSLTKANKSALLKIAQALANSTPLEALTRESQKTKGENVAKVAAWLQMDDAEAKSLQRCGAEAMAVLAAVAE